MTAQIGDSIRYAGKYYSLVGGAPDDPRVELFNPERFGISTFSDCSACWRGYVATYGLRENHLMLEELEINVRDPEREEELKRLTELKEIRRYLPPHRRGPKPQLKPMKPGPCGPAIHGVLPVSPVDPYAHFTFSDNYHNLGLPQQFSGGLMLRDGFIHELYEHMGFHPAWKFEEVIELIFSEGVLTAARDRSADMEKIRKSKARAGGKAKGLSSPQRKSSDG